MKSAEAESRGLIIGYGNPLRGDDGAGAYVAELLAKRLEGHPIEVMVCHQLTPELSDPISRAPWVLFIDATQGAEPGLTACRAVFSGGEQPVTHHMNPEGLLAMASSLFGQSPQRAVLWTITGGYWGHSETLTEPVRRACQRLVRRLTRQVLVEGLPCMNCPSPKPSCKPH